MIESSDDWITGMEGNFPIHRAIYEGKSKIKNQTKVTLPQMAITLIQGLSLPTAMPSGTKIVSAVSSGVSAWAKTAKVTVTQPDGSPKRYFLKVRLLQVPYMAPVTDEGRLGGLRLERKGSG